VHVKTKLNYGFAQGTNIGWRLVMDTRKDHNTDYTLEVFDKCRVWARPGFRTVYTPYLTTCNCDVVFIWPYWWHGIMETFKRYDTAVCVNPMSPREPGWGYGEPGYREHLTFAQSTNPDNILKLIEERNGQMVDGLTCWCSVFKASALDELGMFDERFWPGAGEDYDFMGRMYAAGYRALATSLSWVYHWWGQSKDESDGLDTALPPARGQWNKLARGSMA
jgi:GT2 family glycosyltransferase